MCPQLQATSTRCRFERSPLIQVAARTWSSGTLRLPTRLPFALTTMRTAPEPHFSSRGPDAGLIRSTTATGVVGLASQISCAKGLTASIVKSSHGRSAEGRIENSASVLAVAWRLRIGRGSGCRTPMHLQPQAFSLFLLGLQPHRLADDLFHDLVGAAADRAQAGVADGSLDAVLTHVAVAA